MLLLTKVLPVVLLTSLSLSCHCIIIFLVPQSCKSLSLMSLSFVLSHLSSLCQSFSLALRNSFGRAEEVKLITSTQFPRWGQTLQLELTKPFIRDLRKRYATQPVCGGQCVLMYLGPFKNTTHCIELPTRLMVCERMSMYMCTYMSVFQRCRGSTVIRSTVAEMLLSESIVEVSSLKRCRPKCLW